MRDRGKGLAALLQLEGTLYQLSASLLSNDFRQENHRVDDVVMHIEIGLVVLISRNIANKKNQMTQPFLYGTVSDIIGKTKKERKKERKTNQPTNQPTKQTNKHTNKHPNKPPFCICFCVINLPLC